MIIVGNKYKLEKLPIDVPKFYIGRPNVLGNKFQIGIHGTRSEVIAKYEVWLREAYVNDPKVRSAINDLKFKSVERGAIVLVCWCAPLACHGDVIKEFIRELLELENSNAR